MPSFEVTPRRIATSTIPDGIVVDWQGEVGEDQHEVNFEVDGVPYVAVVTFQTWHEHSESAPSKEETQEVVAMVRESDRRRKASGIPRTITIYYRPRRAIVSRPRARERGRCSSGRRRGSRRTTSSSSASRGDPDPAGEGEPPWGHKPGELSRRREVAR